MRVLILFYGDAQVIFTKFRYCVRIYRVVVPLRIDFSLNNQLIWDFNLNKFLINDECICALGRFLE